MLKRMKQNEFTVSDNGDIRLTTKMLMDHSTHDFYMALKKWRLKDKNKDKPQPYIAHASNYLELINGYNIDYDFAERLIAGTVQQRGVKFETTEQVTLIRKFSTQKTIFEFKS